MKKLLKRIGFGLLGMLILLLIISFLLPSEREVEASVKIDAPIEIVFDQVNDLRNWEYWSPWKTLDPSMEMSYSNPPSGKGAFYVWRSNDPKLGSGKLILTEVVPSKKIVVAMDFDKGDDNTATFDFEEKGKYVKVTWSMTHRVGGNPVQKYKLLLQKGELRRLFDLGLSAMRVKCETR